MSSIRMTALQVLRAILVTAALLLWGVKTSAVSPSAQVRRGEVVAQLQCAACHVVAEKQKYAPLPGVPAPSFQIIANRPQISDAALRHFIATTHWDRRAVAVTMPNPGLTETDIAAVSRYILSLKRH